MTTVLYEHPLNERIRTFLRLEHLFHQAEHFLNSAIPWDNQACVSSIIEILNTLERSDVRAELVKEIDRHMGALSRLMNTPAINRKQLDTILDALHLCNKKIQTVSGKLQQQLRSLELLNHIRQRSSLPMGACTFDIPIYSYFLHQSKGFKTEHLVKWFQEFSAFQEAIDLVLDLTRKSSLFEHKEAQAGFFQKSLETQVPCQMVRVLLPRETPMFPEISGGKHRINVRFLTYSDTERPKQVTETVPFDICYCTL